MTLATDEQAFESLNMRLGNFEHRCPTCKDKGTYKWKGVEHTCPTTNVDFNRHDPLSHFGDYRDHDQWRMFRKYTQRNIPERYMRADWFAITDTEFKSNIDEFVELLPAAIENGIGVFFHSEGLASGKTFAACHILKRVSYDRTEGMHYGYGYADGWFATFDDALSYDDEDQARMIDARLLVIDDLRAPSTVKQIEMFGRTIEHVIRKRASQMKPTVITSNITWDDLQATYPRCHSVLLDCTEVIALDAKLDYRLYQATNVDRRQLLRTGEIPPIT